MHIKIIYTSFSNVINNFSVCPAPHLPITLKLVKLILVVNIELESIIVLKISQIHILTTKWTELEIQDYLIPSIFPIFKLHLNYNNKFKQSFFRATISSFYLNHIRIYVQYIYLSLYFPRDSILISCLSSIKIFAPRKKRIF